MNYNEALQHCIFRYTSGSHAYGFNTSESDEDFRGVFIAPLLKAFELFQTSFVDRGSLENYIKTALENLRQDNKQAAKENLHQAVEAIALNDQDDLNLSVGSVARPGNDEELQELRKFFKLSAGCNPNIIEYLYVDRLITHRTPVWDRIRANRDLFLSKRARFTFSGYAVAQLKRIQTHRGYLLNPPGKKPVRVDYGLPEETTIPKEMQNALLSVSLDWVQSDIRETVKQEKIYQKAMNEWRAYDKWKRERNEKRQELERKWGYDSKHAVHLVRLIRMAKEILTTGEVLVFRPDHEELLAIRNGAWPYEKLVEYAENIDQELDDLYKKSALQAKPDHRKISELYLDICEEQYGMKIR
ncbi:MAG: nucleotidyltransferase domain-containing protein [Candidatus Nanopelagicaceae bacterium]|nr:nucleotidyltransferase domain-containing protein [Candidatus Nanopelagicaceae bacterium]